MISSSQLARTPLATALVCCMALSACGKGADNQAAAPRGQVIAQIGSETITTQELENEFRLGNIPADQQKDPQTIKRILSDLVTRKYLVRQALDSKLDREPGVLLDILRSRELVLANAAISRNVAGKLSALSQSDVDKYIASNPLKFANRQLITVEQITFQVGPNSQTVTDATRDVKSLDEADQKLTEMNVPHTRSTGVINSGELPENLSHQFQTRKPDDVFFLRSGPNGIFMVVKGEESQPLSGEAAINFARQALRADLLKSEVGMAAVAANLGAKFEGDYAHLMGKPMEDQGENKK